MDGIGQHDSCFRSNRLALTKFGLFLSLVSFFSSYINKQLLLLTGIVYHLLLGGHLTTNAQYTAVHWQKLRNMLNLPCYISCVCVCARACARACVVSLCQCHAFCVLFLSLLLLCLFFYFLSSCRSYLGVIKPYSVFYNYKIINFTKLR